MTTRLAGRNNSQSSHQELKLEDEEVDVDGRTVRVR